MSAQQPPRLTSHRTDEWRPTPEPLCATDPDLWFAEDFDSAEEARAICRVCPAIDACSTAAHDLKPTHGMWAGVVWCNRRPSNLYTRRGGPSRKDGAA